MGVKSQDVFLLSRTISRVRCISLIPSFLSCVSLTTGVKEAERLADPCAASWSQGAVIGAFVRTSRANGGCGGVGPCRFSLDYEFGVSAVGYCAATGQNWQTVCVNSASGPIGQMEMINGAAAPNPASFKRDVSSDRGEGVRSYRFRKASGSIGVSATNMSIGTTTLQLRPANVTAMIKKYAARSLDLSERGFEERNVEREDEVDLDDWVATYDTIVEMM